MPATPCAARTRARARAGRWPTPGSPADRPDWIPGRRTPRSRHRGGRTESLRERLHFGLGVLDAPARSEAKVQVEVAAGGNHVASGEAFDPRDRHHLAKDQLADADVPRGLRGQMREQRACLVDGVVALPRTCRVGAPALER